MLRPPRLGLLRMRVARPNLLPACLGLRLSLHAHLRTSVPPRLMVARLQEEARAVSASHRQVLVKVVCNYRRTDDLNPGLCISVVHALNLAAARSRVRAYRLVDSAPVLGAQSLFRCRL